MRRGVPTRSFRQDTAMAGAIFMSNAESREQCFRLNIFGLPLEYEPFVNNVKEGMPLFLFDHTERKLYGVFEATSDGGLNINRSAFRSIWRSYPAQVCFKIVWKCRPLTEDEFSLAIEENYYMPKKFYFDLSYQQIVRLYGLFDEKRVEHPICNYSKSANLEKEQPRKGTPDKRSLTPNISPVSADQSHILMSLSTPKVSTVETNYSAHTSMHPIVPLRVETQPNVSMPLGTKLFGVQIAPIRSSHHGQIELPYLSNELFQDASTVDGISTQVSSPCSQTTRNHRDQLVANQSYPLPHDYPHNSLSSGCMTRDPTDGVRLSANQSYPLPHDYPHNSLSSGCMTRDPTDGVRLFANQSYSSSLGYVRSSLLSPQYITQDPTGRDRNYVSSTYTPYAPSYPHFSLANPQGNANWKDHYDIHCNQCRFGPHEDIFASEHQYLSKGKSLTPPKLSQQGIPAYPEAPVVSAIGQRTESSTDYISIPHCDEDFENDKWKHGFNCNASGSSGHGNYSRAYMSEQLHTNHDIGAESNTIVPGQRRQRSVFSRLSLNQQPPSEEITGPSLNQLLQSLSQRTKQWSSENRTLTDDVGGQLVGEQVMDRPCPLAELNLPSLLGEESTEPPFLNFKRRSEAGKLDANLGKEISGKVKRRKLVCPSFGEDNNAASSGKELQGNGVEDRRHSHVEVGGNKLNIDLNRPATVDSDLVKEDGSIVLCPAVVIKIQTEKPCEVDTNKPNCSNAMGVISKQDPSLDNGITAEKVSLDLNVADLDTVDESKLQAILGSSLLQALGKHRSGSPNNSEEARSSICVEDRKVNMAMNSDGNTKPRGN